MVAWFVCPYKRAAVSRPERYCAMDDFTDMIRGDGGDWRESEVLGNRAIVRVSASDSTINTIAGTPTFRRIPLALLDDPLSSLSQAARNAIRNELLDAGYPLSEINEALPDLSAVTLRDVLRFFARRRLKPRYDAVTDTVVCDGPVQPCLTPDHLEQGV